MVKIVTIDGLSATGKTSVVDTLAPEMGWQKLNIGKVLRKIAFIRQTEKLGSGPRAFKQAINRKGLLDNLELPEYATPKVSKLTLRLFDDDESLDICGEFLRRHVQKLDKVMVDGRIAGTRFFPDADFKIALLAAPETRAKRCLARYPGLTLEQIMAKLDEHDAAERERFGRYMNHDKADMTLHTDRVSAVGVKLWCKGAIGVALSSQPR